tara:strand:- start:15437 stop:15754 length:318 start_codon:yes stop_codon:yes gene_type:complete
MSDSTQLSPRIVIQIVLALEDGQSGTWTQVSLIRRAKRIGLSEAEIDAARDGRSFEAKSSAAIRLAKAVLDQSGNDLIEAREHAAAFGLCSVEIRQIEKLATTLR